MTTKRLAGLAVICALVTPLITRDPTSTHAAPATPAAVKLRYRVLFSPFFLLDLGRKGLSAGDAIISHDLLRNHEGRTIGHDGSVCTVTDPKRPEANCVVTFRLPGGSVTAQFLNTPPPSKLAAVTGGTGRYRDAGGQVRIVESPTSRGGTITFRLSGVL